jgi:glutamyl-tRNA reductase
VIDAGFPPQVEPVSMPGLRLIPLDAIRQGEDGVLAARQAAIPAVEAMVDEAVAGWVERRSERRLSGTIRRLHEQADDITRQLGADLVAIGVPGGDAERILRRHLRRLVHGMVTELRDAEPAVP